MIIPIYSGHTFILCPVLVPKIKKWCRKTWECPKESHKDDQKAGEPALWRKTWRTWVSCLWRRLRGELVTVFQYSKGIYKEGGDSLFTSSHMETWRRQGAMGAISIRRAFISIEERNFLQWQQSFTGKQPPHRHVGSPCHWRFSGCDWTGC